MVKSSEKYHRFWGTVLMRTKGYCLVLSEDEREIMCHIKGSLFEHDSKLKQLAVGDIVRVRFSKNDSKGLIGERATRSSFFQRRTPFSQQPQIIAANLDLIGMIIPIEPEFKINLLIRFLLAAIIGQIKPLVILNKVDLAGKAKSAKIMLVLRSAGIDCLTHSIYDDNSIEEIKSKFKQKKVLLAGQSGVGKTALLNHLFPGLALKTGRVNLKTQKGRHTTALAYMRCLNREFKIIDTPGFKEFRPHIPDLILLGQLFEPFGDWRFSCRLKNCQHVSEPFCAVKQALKDGQINDQIYEGYCKFYHDELAARKKERFLNYRKARS